MPTTPGYADAVDDLREALKVICQTITPNTDAEPYATFRRVAPPYWSMLFQRTTPSNNDGSEYWRLEETVILTYHTGYLTEPTVTMEERAHEVKVAAAVEFLQRPFLQSSDVWARGVEAIHPEGVSVRDVSIVQSGKEGQQTLAVQVTLSIPLLLQIDETNY